MCFHLLVKAHSNRLDFVPAYWESGAMKKNRIGILGGSFNPPHVGHLIIAQNAYEEFGLSKVIFVPSKQPPHKAPRSVIDPSHRMAMTASAIAGDNRFELSDMELSMEGPSYTINTIRQLHLRYPDTELCFIIGADSLLELHLWKDIVELLGLCRFVTFVRPGFGSNGIMESDVKLPAPWPNKLLSDVRPGLLVAVSSSEVRRRVAEGLSIKYLVPQAVEVYITSNELYK